MADGHRERIGGVVRRWRRVQPEQELNHLLHLVFLGTAVADDRPLDLSDERKSISSETTFLNDTDNRTTLRAALRELAADVAQTLELQGLGALTIQVKVRYSDFKTVTRQLRVEEPLASASDLYRLACTLLAKHKLVTKPLRLLGICVSTLVPPFSQLRLAL